MSLLIVWYHLTGTFLLLTKSVRLATSSLLASVQSYVAVSSILVGLAIVLFFVCDELNRPSFLLESHYNIIFELFK